MPPDSLRVETAECVRGGPWDGEFKDFPPSGILEVRTLDKRFVGAYYLYTYSDGRTMRGVWRPD